MCCDFFQDEKKDLNINEKDQEHHEVWRTFKQVMTSRILIIRCCVLFVLWAINAFVFYGLSLNATSLSGNKYLNFILVCLVEIPGYTLSWIAMNKIGRRWALAGSYLLCSFTCAAGGFVPQGKFPTSVVLLYSFSSHSFPLCNQIGHGRWFRCFYLENLGLHRPLQRHMCIQLR